MARGRSDWTVETLGFQGPGSNQTLFSVTYDIIGANTWETIKTVTTGKTAFVDLVIFSDPNGNSTNARIGSNSTADINVRPPLITPFQSLLKSPLQYTSGTNIQVRSDSVTSKVTILGWEE